MEKLFLILIHLSPFTVFTFSIKAGARLLTGPLIRQCDEANCCLILNKGGGKYLTNSSTAAAVGRDSSALCADWVHKKSEVKQCLSGSRVKKTKNVHRNRKVMNVGWAGQ